MKVDYIEVSKRYAFSCHKLTNHLYDGQPYSVHLEMVHNTAKKFIHLIPVHDQELVLSSTYLHDTIEDTRQTYNDVRSHTNHFIADIVYALTNEKGKNREQRANARYYKGIRKTKYAVFIKLCDRIANLEYSKSKGSKMFQTYVDENPKFIKALTKRNFFTSWFKKENKYQELIDYIQTLIKN